MSAITLEDTGHFALTVRTPEGQDGQPGAAVTQLLDLWQVNNRIYQIQLEHQGKTAVEFHAAIVNYLMELGFPQCSQKLADDFVGAIGRAMKDVQKKSAMSGSETQE